MVRDLQECGTLWVQITTQLLLYCNKIVVTKGWMMTRMMTTIMPRLTRLQQHSNITIESRCCSLSLMQIKVMGRSVNNTRLPICLCVTVCIVQAATYCALARRNIYRQLFFVLVALAKLMCFPCRRSYLNGAITYTGTPIRVYQYL